MSFVSSPTASQTCDRPFPSAPSSPKSSFNQDKVSKVSQSSFQSPSKASEARPTPSIQRCSFAVSEQKLVEVTQSLWRSESQDSREYPESMLARPVPSEKVSEHQRYLFIMKVADVNPFEAARSVPKAFLKESYQIEIAKKILHKNPEAFLQHHQAFSIKNRSALKGEIKKLEGVAYRVLINWIGGIKPKHEGRIYRQVKEDLRENRMETLRKLKTYGLSDPNVLRIVKKSLLYDFFTMGNCNPKFPFDAFQDLSCLENYFVEEIRRYSAYRASASRLSPHSKWQGYSFALCIKNLHAEIPDSKFFLFVCRAIASNDPVKFLDKGEEICAIFKNQSEVVEELILLAVSSLTKRSLVEKNELPNWENIEKYYNKLFDFHISESFFLKMVERIIKDAPEEFNGYIYESPFLVLGQLKEEKTRAGLACIYASCPPSKNKDLNARDAVYEQLYLFRIEDKSSLFEVFKKISIGLKKPLDFNRFGINSQEVLENALTFLAKNSFQGTLEGKLSRWIPNEETRKELLEKIAKEYPVWAYGYRAFFDVTGNDELLEECARIHEESAPKAIKNSSGCVIQ